MTDLANETPSVMGKIKETKTTFLTQKGLIFFRLLDFCSLMFWSYVILKVFISDVDIYILEKFFPANAWLLQLKSIILLLILAISLIFFEKKLVLFFITYILFFPFILFFWKIPKIIYRRQSWVAVFGFANLINSFFGSLRYNLIITSAFVTSATIVFISSNRFLLWIALLVMTFTLYVYFVDRFVSTIKPKNIFYLYNKVVLLLKNYIMTKLVPDPEIINVPYSSLTEEQTNTLKTNLQSAVIASRLCLLLAKKLRNYQASKVGFYSGAFAIIFIVLLTVVVFAVINFALFKIDQSHFMISEFVNFFTFVYYSFNAVVFQRITELTPITISSQIFWMMEAACALYFALIFVTVMFSARNQSQTEELDETVKIISGYGKNLEVFVLDKYKFANMDDAVKGLINLKAESISFIYKISADV